MGSIGINQPVRHGLWGLGRNRCGLLITVADDDGVALNIVRSVAVQCAV